MKTKTGLLCGLVVFAMSIGAAAAKSPGGPGDPPPTLIPNDATLAPLNNSPLPTLPGLPERFNPLTAPAPQLEQTNTSVAADEAARMIEDFAAQYLGVTLQMQYAADLSQGDTGARQADINTFVTFFKQLPPNGQTLSGGMGSADAVYWGVFQDGAAMLALGNCSPDCALKLDKLDFYLSNSSGGAFGTYIDALPADSTEALSLLQAIYPNLAKVYLTPTSGPRGGFAFQAGIPALPGAAAGTVYAGTLPVDEQTLAYAVVTVGAGYVSAKVS
jgi:rhodanese-related sulfurtransferase